LEKIIRYKKVIAISKKKDLKSVCNCPTFLSIILKNDVSVRREVMTGKTLKVEP
jgi:hypothetical protein